MWKKDILLSSSLSSLSLSAFSYFFSLFIFLMGYFNNNFYLCESCKRIRIESTEDGLDWIEGIFEMDKIIRMDDRLIYREINGSRVIYHFSGNDDDNNNNDNNHKIREKGRWLLGAMESIGSDSGWAYRHSWSISPDDIHMNILQNHQDELSLHWKVFLGDEWTDVDSIHFYCESISDFLFITTEDIFEENELTYQSIHGFYIRINENTFAKITGGSKRVFYQTNEQESKIFIITDISKIQDPNSGIPSVDIVATVTEKLVKTSSDPVWRLYGHDNKVLMNDVNIVILQTQQRDKVNDHSDVHQDTIYDLVRNYYHKLKEEEEEENDDKKSSSIPRFPLNNGMDYPAIGLGTGGLSGVNQNYQVIKEAVIQHHYRAIDSATAYESEPSIGKLLTEHKSLRSKLFLTSKIWPTDLYFGATLESVQKSLNTMKVNYIDVYMLHWPACYEDLSFMDCTHSKDGKWEQSYDALSKLYSEGIILNLGVSNWNEELMINLLQEFPIKPQIVQNHVDLNNLNWDFYDFLKDHDILLQAYSTFRGLAEYQNEEYQELNTLLHDICTEIEADQRIKISASQLVLRFMVENGIAAIPRSTKSLHLKENHNIFDFQFTDEHNIRLGGREAPKEEL